jgi:hypothetical protein
MRLIVILMLSIPAGISAQDKPINLLRLLQSKVADSVDRMPRYMCTQTIDRSQYEPDIPNGSTRCGEGPTEGPKTHLTTGDRLRLDVGIGATSEIYSWVGENRFNDRDLLDVVREGAISTGSFAAFLTAIFRTDAADFTSDGETTLNGRPVTKFGFRVPYERSHYLYGSGQHRVVTGYGGTFFVDRQTADLVLDYTHESAPQGDGSLLLLDSAGLRSRAA